MTTVERPAHWRTPLGRFRDSGGTASAAHITAAGSVLVVTVAAELAPDERGRQVLWPTAARAEVIGSVDPNRAEAWRLAGELLERAGWRPVGPWTTVRRYPACPVVRA